jgi:hypothetical protein
MGVGERLCEILISYGRLPAGSILTSGFNSPYFTGHFFCFWSLLEQFGLILVNFCCRFFSFCLFFNFQ